ncbi:hemagglutinin/hemolysin-related protein [Neisseria gonorrhoeae NCCP11945]|uniref:Hemagglutinin/hemolysin-related protein n=1 Tax=Neisseria gonorrhoeae (strain NCCP11945) TaxID=521006 RepID=B4RM28_NEIG2|nr:hemagglutinin/hemolysin-related protein [Neisseria gonorrhoeae NCCP11945]
MGASVAVSGKTLGQGAKNKPQDKHLTSVADKNGASSSVGYGSDSDSQSSITKSGINTQKHSNHRRSRTNQADRQNSGTNQSRY